MGDGRLGFGEIDFLLRALLFSIERNIPSHREYFLAKFSVHRCTGLVLSHEIHA